MRYLNSLLERPATEHWRFPVAYAAAGTRMYSLSEVVSTRPAIKPPADLGHEEWRELILMRMRMHSV